MIGICRGVRRWAVTRLDQTRERVDETKRDVSLLLRTYCQHRALKPDAPRTEPEAGADPKKVAGLNGLFGVLFLIKRANPEVLQLE